MYLTLSASRGDAAREVYARDPDWVAPSLWASEFRNALLVHVRAKRIDEATSKRVWTVARPLVRDVAIEPLDVLNLALSTGLSGYDAEFAALAASLDVSLVTDDRRVLRAVPGLAVSIDDFAAAV